MIPGYVWLIKLVLSHLVTDFILQPSSWVEDRNKYHFASVKLYLHVAITTLMAWIFMGFAYPLVAVTIFVTHLLIDAWKSYRKPTVAYFIIDQLLHLLVIAVCWYIIFLDTNIIHTYWKRFNDNTHTWAVITAVVFLTTPTGILIGNFTKQWRDKIEGAENLANAGKWIGIVERIIVLILVANNQYSAIGLLLTAKGLIRFSEKDRPEIKTEYLVIGTLLSIGTAVVTGLLLKL